MIWFSKWRKSEAASLCRSASRGASTLQVRFAFSALQQSKFEKWSVTWSVTWSAPWSAIVDRPYCSMWIHLESVLSFTWPTPWNSWKTVRIKSCLWNPPATTKVHIRTTSKSLLWQVHCNANSSFTRCRGPKSLTSLDYRVRCLKFRLCKLCKGHLPRWRKQGLWPTHEPLLPMEAVEISMLSREKLGELLVQCSWHCDVVIEDRDRLKSIQGLWANSSTGLVDNDWRAQAMSLPSFILNLYVPLPALPFPCIPPFHFIRNICYQQYTPQQPCLSTPPALYTCTQTWTKEDDPTMQHPMMKRTNAIRHQRLPCEHARPCQLTCVLLSRGSSSGTHQVRYLL